MERPPGGPRTRCDLRRRSDSHCLSCFAAAQGRSGVQGKMPLVRAPCSGCRRHHHHEPEEVVHKKCRRYVCCPPGAVECEVVHESGGRPRTARRCPPVEYVTISVSTPARPRFGYSEEGIYDSSLVPLSGAVFRVLSSQPSVTQTAEGRQSVPNENKTIGHAKFQATAEN